MISYEPLYRTLEKKQMPMNVLSVAIGFAATSLGSCISRKENLTSTTIQKICEVLECGIEDVIENVPDGTVIEHKTTVIRRERGGENMVKVNWEKLEEDISKAGMSLTGVSKAMDKAQNFLVRKKKLKHIALTTVQEIAKVIGTDCKDYI